MKKSRGRNIFFTILAIVTLGLIGWYFLKPADFSEMTTAEQLASVEKDIEDIYEEEGQELNLRKFNNKQEEIADQLTYLEGSVSLQSDRTKLDQLKRSWDLLKEMAYVKGELDERFNLRNGRLKSDEDLPDDFEERLNQLEDEKPGFYQKYTDLYEDYLEALEAEEEDEEEDSSEESSSSSEESSEESSSSSSDQVTSPAQESSSQPVNTTAPRSTYVPPVRSDSSSQGTIESEASTATTAPAPPAEPNSEEEVSPDPSSDPGPSDEGGGMDDSGTGTDE